MKPIHIGIGLTAVVLALALLELGPVLEVLAPYRGALWRQYGPTVLAYGGLAIAASVAAFLRAGAGAGPGRPGAAERAGRALGFDAVKGIRTCGTRSGAMRAGPAHRLQSPENASLRVHSRRSRPTHTAWFVRPEVHCRCRRPRHRPSGRRPDAGRTRCGTPGPRPVSSAIPCSLTGPAPSDRQELLGRHPSRCSRRLSNTTTARLLPSTSSSECRVVPEPTETSPLRPSWRGPSEFAPLPGPGRSAARVQVGPHHPGVARLSSSITVLG